MNPGFSIGPITIYYYGVILTLAILLGYAWARKRAQRYGVKPEVIDAVLLIVTPLAVIGARLYFVLFSFEYFSTHLGEIFNFRGGGMAIHGALIGGALGMVLVWLYHRKKNPLKFSALLDILAPVLPLSQAVGRIANYINQEAFGGPTDLPWGIFIDPARRPAQFVQAERFHPTFAYEAIWNLLGVALVLGVEKRLRARGLRSGGVVFAIYLAWYSVGRFWIEGLRTDALLLGPLRIAQIVSILALLGSLGFIWYRYSQWRRKRTAHAS